MSINKENRNERKFLEKIRGCTYNITHMSVTSNPRLPNLVPNQSDGKISFVLICLFVNIYFNIRNTTKNGRKIKGLYLQQYINIRSK